MRKALVVLLGVCLLALFVGSVSARDIDRSGKRAMRAIGEEEYADLDQGIQTLMTAAAADTYCIVWYDFETMNWQGWTQKDNTEQEDVYFHVDDFSGLAGGSQNRLYPIEGTKSLWCGTRPGSSFYLCSWKNAPGYGNNWNQMFMTPTGFPFTGELVWTYTAVYDSEPDFDQTFVEYDSGNFNWVELAMYDGADTVFASHSIRTGQVATKLRYHFVADGAWSDQDGLWDTDGAIIVDEITVSDASGLLYSENFESYAVGYNGPMGIWEPTVEPAFGIYSALANNLEDKDPCGDNFGSQVIFYNGSGEPDSDYPGLFKTPFCTGPGGIEAPCQDEAIISPVIDMTRYTTNDDEIQDAAIPDVSALGGAILRFTAYRDIPLTNLVFYTWSVRDIIDGCPGQWLDRNFVYYGGDKDYIFGGFDVSDLIGPNPTQVRVGLVDQCAVWYDVYGDCADHTPSPWIDNVRVYRYETIGPSWSVRMLDQFQDTFPEEVSGSPDPMEEFCRADMANDVAPGDEWDRIDPGDSAVVQVSAPLWATAENETGLALTLSGYPAVYFHCNVTFLGLDGKPDISGAGLEGDWGTWLETDVNGWDVFLCDSALTGAGNWSEDKYCIDLNDSILTRGYMVEYYFKAFDLNGDASWYPLNAEPEALYKEFTCLPTLRVVPGALYCDDFHNRGTYVGTPETYFWPAFEAVVPTANDMPDRYDTNGPSSGVSNGIGAYVSGAGAQSIFSQAYEKVIHDSGDLNSVTITDGSANSDKSNDAQLFVDWLTTAENDVGLLVMGDQVAYDLSFSEAAVATEFVTTICGVSLVDNSYYDVTGGRDAGGVVTPLITGVAGGPFEGLSYYAYGGCFIINDFDVLEKNGPGEYALQYPDFGGDPYYAGIYTRQLTGNGSNLKTIWVGHSFMLIRDTGTGTAPARNTFLKMVYEEFLNEANTEVTGDDSPAAYHLAQNFPNPFNPSTRIQFALPVKGHVSLKIYNVAGQLVKTLQNGVMDAGSHELTWDGSNNLGKNVASGVYFYKLNAGDNYENMKKMVLLR
jgi:hypothetical protein